MFLVCAYDLNDICQHAFWAKNEYKNGYNSSSIEVRQVIFGKNEDWVGIHAQKKTRHLGLIWISSYWHILCELKFFG